VALFPESKGQQGNVRGTETSRTGGVGSSCYGEFGRVPHGRRGDGGSAARFFYCAKVSKSERNLGLEWPQDDWPKALHVFDGEPFSRVSDKIVVQRCFHPTVKPVELMRYLLRLVTPPGGRTLDPFGGSGTTPVAAILEGFQPVYFDMSEAYTEIARARARHAGRKQPKSPQGLLL